MHHLSKNQVVCRFPTFLHSFKGEQWGLNWLSSLHSKHQLKGVFSCWLEAIKDVVPLRSADKGAHGHQYLLCPCLRVWQPTAMITMFILLQNLKYSHTTMMYHNNSKFYFKCVCQWSQITRVVLTMDHVCIGG